jgi:hypothetical protein
VVGGGGGGCPTPSFPNTCSYCVTAGMIQKRAITRGNAAQRSAAEEKESRPPVRRLPEIVPLKQGETLMGDGLVTARKYYDRVLVQSSAAGMYSVLKAKRQGTHKSAKGFCSFCTALTNFPEEAC